MFIKHSDGKIVSVVDENELSKEQKKVCEDLSKQVIKTEITDTSEMKKSGSN